MKRSLLSLTLAIIICLSLVLSGCSGTGAGNGGETTSSTAQSTTPAPQKSDEQIKAEKAKVVEILSSFRTDAEAELPINAIFDITKEDIVKIIKETAFEATVDFEATSMGDTSSFDAYFGYKDGVGVVKGLSYILGTAYFVLNEDSAHMAYQNGNELSEIESTYFDIDALLSQIKGLMEESEAEVTGNVKSFVTTAAYDLLDFSDFSEEYLIAEKNGYVLDNEYFENKLWVVFEELIDAMSADYPMTEEEKEETRDEFQAILDAIEFTVYLEANDVTITHVTIDLFVDMALIDDTIGGKEETEIMPLAATSEEEEEFYFGFSFSADASDDGELLENVELSFELATEDDGSGEFSFELTPIYKGIILEGFDLNASLNFYDIEVGATYYGENFDAFEIMYLTHMGDLEMSIDATLDLTDTTTSGVEIASLNAEFSNTEKEVLAKMWDADDYVPVEEIEGFEYNLGDMDMAFSFDVSLKNQGVDEYKLNVDFVYSSERQENANGSMSIEADVFTTTAPNFPTIPNAIAALKK